MSGQGAFGDRGCGFGGALAAIAVAVVLFVALMVLVDAMPPAQQPPNDTTQVQP